MNVSRWGCFSRVEVRMRIHPDHAEPAVSRRAANGTNRQAMITTKHKRKTIALNGCCHCAGHTPPHGNDALNIFKLVICDTARFLNGHFDIAFVFKAVFQLFKLLMKMSITDRTGPHIHTAAIRAEIKGHTDDVYVHELPPKC